MSAATAISTGTTPRAREPRTRSRRLVVWSVLGLTLIGLCLRVWGAAWGLPGGLHPDEWAIVETAVDMAAQNTFDPDLYLRPNHLEAKASLVGFQIYAHAIAGVPVEVAFAESRDPFLVISRLVIAIFGAAMVVLSYAILAPTSRRAGLIAAALVAVNPFYVEHSHYATPDVPLTAMVMVGMLGLSRYLSSEGRLLPLLIACAGTGAAITSKYPGALFTVVIAIAVLAIAVRRRSVATFLRHGLIAIAGTALAVFLASPGLVLNADRVVAALQQESRDTHDGADGLGALGNALFYGEVFAGSAGILVAGFAVLGVGFAIRRRLIVAIPMGAGLVFWIALSALSLHWDRWAAPMIITGLLFAGLGAHAALTWGARASRRGALGAVVLAIAVGFTASAAQSAAEVARFSTTDTRLDSRDELSRLGVTRSNSLYEGYTPFLPNAPLGLFSSFTTVGDRIAPVDESKRFVVLSELQYGRYEGDARHREQREFYAALREQYPLVASFAPSIELTGRSPFEWVQIDRATRSIVAAAHGGSTGPLVEVLQIP